MRRSFLPQRMDLILSLSKTRGVPAIRKGFLATRNVKCSLLPQDYHPRPSIMPVVERRSPPAARRRRPAHLDAQRAPERSQPARSSASSAFGPSSCHKAGRERARRRAGRQPRRVAAIGLAYGGAGSAERGRDCAGSASDAPRRPSRGMWRARRRARAPRCRARRCLAKRRAPRRRGSVNVAPGMRPMRQDVEQRLARAVAVGRTLLAGGRVDAAGRAGYRRRRASRSSGLSLWRTRGRAARAAPSPAPPRPRPRSRAAELEGAVGGADQAVHVQAEMLADARAPRGSCLP